MSIFAQLFGDFDRSAHAIDRVIGVHQEHAIVGQCSCISFKRLPLAFEKHDPTVRLRSAGRNPVVLARLQIRRAGTAADVGRTGSRQTAINSLGATQTKFDYRVIFSSKTDACRLRRNETLEIQDVEQSRFQELALDDGAANPDERFIRENQRSFRNRINVASQSQTAQVIEKAGIKQRLAIVSVLRGKIIYLSFGEIKRAQKVDRRREPARERESTTKRVLTKSDVERRLVITHTGFPIAARHSDLIKVSR